MRRIRLSAVTLFGTLACAAACSSSPTTPSSPSPEHPAPASPSPAPTTAPSAARTLSLIGDGHTLHLSGAPADPTYVATYPVSGLTAMTVTSSAFGDLSASCASGGGAVACKELPFFSEVGGGTVKVFDAYGHPLLALPASPIAPPDAGGVAVPPLPPGLDASVGGGFTIDAGGCAPSVTASLSGCSLTVGGVTCDCSDPSCTSSAIEACLGSAGVPIGAGGGGGGGFLPDAGLPGLGGFGDAGVFGGAACSAAAIASAKAGFCSDVDAWLTANGVSATLDCSAIGTLTFPTTLPAASTTGFTCDQITHDAFVKVRTELATCDPLEYVGWDSSAELQLFEDSACTVW